ncbi:putative peptidyl-tRNA hydrolase PTRHD1 [Gracilariopsis chorda]|uniref:peptidyl-tRNA hydrolase n=1 Tax=Gracilariopsis chorda TaxID=448386 RepID=A0A2V3IEF8_9FLOR|nr:putative peptidyl-tRNA hydrolase PTRHD1 [Gracilariopsis chorda]PXF42061.1 putative peptidyl-tRNA hydrolase PTRHD1 [Gracilariopsis chorda]|eukprot:PXF39580.1 putative peptidyl-tRNA hydrolase PTRHD1 [Gracilariopsis chorda]
MSAAAPHQPPPQPQQSQSQPLVQYVVLRRDLLNQWPLGSVIAQGVHASVAAIWQSRTTPATLQYCSDSQLASMRTVVLQADHEPALRHLAAQLARHHVLFTLWTEHPENFVTALATHPGLVPALKPHFSHLKLFR